MYLEKTGQIDAAIQSLERSLELKPNDSAVSEHLGRLHLNAAASRNRVGRHADALAHAESAVKLRPDDHNSHVKLGETLQAMGRLGDALGALRRSLALDSMDGAERLAISSSIKDLEHLISLESRLPGVLAGTVRPTNDVEGVEFARLCFHHGKFASAARLFGEFAPLQLADEEVVLSGTMKQAIVAAALAGSEPANDTSTPDDESRQMFRDQSYGWLSQVLSKCSATIHEDDNALAFLDWIRECPELDTLRDPDKLACYPVSEQQRWSTLWDDARAIAAIRKEPAATKP
jgi:tetratricopeptide (TPR) repeat protein